MFIRHLQLISAITFITFSCSGGETNIDQSTEEPINQEGPDTQFANVIKISASGTANNYQFNVTISSPDTGCDQYADYWEVVSMEGDLIYRRILAHSHVDEQPFTRSGGSVAISVDQVVWIRAHMNNAGYGGTALKGSVNQGFELENLDTTFAVNLDLVDPLPSKCQF